MRTQIPLKSIQLPWGSRAALVGHTGCGKTTLARELLNPFQHVVIYDAKGLIKWEGFKRFTSFKALTESREPKRIYAPNPERELDNEQFIEAFFYWVYNRTNTCLFVDEVYSVSRPGWVPKWYRACLTRGREKGITTLSAAQRPAAVPLYIFSESERFYLFGLNLEEDRRRIEHIVPIKRDVLKTTPDYCFYYATIKGYVSGLLRLRTNRLQGHVAA